MLLYGRKVIYTDEPEITYKNVSDVLREAMAEHEINSKDINFLLAYEKGEQKKIRTKKYRSDIDNWCIDNIANEITEFKCSFNWGNPITLSMRERNNDVNQDIANGIFELNMYYDLQGGKSKQQKLARFVEICGVGYTYVDVNTEYEDGDSPFVVEVLDPRCAFVVRSNFYPDNRIILAVTYRCTTDGRKTYTCFTKGERYEINSSFEHIARSGEINPLGMIPIVEWIRSHDRMGCFERQISEMNNLNLLISDFVNDVEQNTQCVWLTTDIEFPKQIVKKEDGTEQEVVVKPQNGDWMQTFTSPDGRTPGAKALTVDYDYQGMLQNILSRRALILQKCNVPARNDNSGGSTGVAMSDATGWTQADTEATKQDQIRNTCKLQEVKVVLKAISKCAGFPIENPINKLRYSDCQANIPRQKTYELTTKINGMIGLINVGAAIEDVATIPLFEDANQFIARSGPGIRKYQETNVFNGEKNTSNSSKRPFPDLSDQETNSPSIGGINVR